MLTQPVTPHLWFDKEAKEAAAFYCAVFPDSKIASATTLRDTPSGDSDVVAFTVFGHPFMAISAGPLFTINPSISFIVHFDPSRLENASERLDEAWRDRKSTRLNSSHIQKSRMPSSA